MSYGLSYGKLNESGVERGSDAASEEDTMVVQESLSWQNSEARSCAPVDANPRLSLLIGIRCPVNVRLESNSKRGALACVASWQLHARRKEAGSFVAERGNRAKGAILGFHMNTTASN